MTVTIPPDLIKQAERVAGIDGQKRFIVVAGDTFGLYRQKFLDERGYTKEDILYESKEGK